MKNVMRVVLSHAGHQFFGASRANYFFSGKPDVHTSPEAARYFKYHASVFVDVLAAGEWVSMHDLFLCGVGVACRCVLGEQVEFACMYECI